MNNGLHPGLSRADYDSLDRVHFSALKHMRRSPLHYKAALLEEEEDSDARLLGRATHAAILEPEKFRSEWAVWRNGRRFGKEWDACCAAHPDVLTAEQFQSVEGMAKAATSSAQAMKYLRGGMAECSLLWTEKESNIECKARLDYLAPGGAIVDLKSARDVSPDGFSRAAYSLDYCAQAAMYVDGHFYATGKLLPYVLVAIENTSPHAVVVYRVGADLLDFGRTAYRGYLTTLARCQREKRWPGYSEDVIDLQLPPWVRREGLSDAA